MKKLISSQRKILNIQKANFLGNNKASPFFLRVIKRGHSLLRSVDQDLKDYSLVR